MKICADEIVYLKIKDTKTGHIHQISTRIVRDDVHFVWQLLSFEYVLSAIEDRVIAKLLGTEDLEFDF